MNGVSLFSAYTYDSGSVESFFDEYSSLLSLMKTSNKTNAAQNVTSEEDNISTVVDGLNGTSTTATGSKLAKAAEQVAMSMGGYSSTGRCLGGVNQALRNAFGEEYGLWQNSAYQSAEVLRSQKPFTDKFKEIKVSKDQLPNLPAGAIVVWAASSGHPHGHISISLGDGRESSDFVGQQMTGRDASFSVFVPIA